MRLVRRMGLPLAWIAVGAILASLAVLLRPDARAGLYDRAALRVAAVRPAVVVLGDSHAAYGGRWPGLGPFVVNLGRPGLMAHQLGPQVEQAAALQPRRVIVFAGTNNLLYPHYDQGETVADVGALLAVARSRGLADLVLVGPVPPADPALARRARDLNQALEIAAGAVGVAFLDPRDASDLAPDGIHLSARGYQAVSALLRQGEAARAGDAAAKGPEFTAVGGR